VKINLITAVTVCRLNNHIVHNEVALDVWRLIFLHFGLRNLPQIVAIGSILKQNLHFVHLEFCRCDLNWIWLVFLVSCCLVLNPTIGLPWRLLLSIKLFSKLRSSLINLWTYRMILFRLISLLIDKFRSVSNWIEFHIVLIWIQTHYSGKDFLCLIWISIVI
jgi:hypothetical protein